LSSSAQEFKNSGTDSPLPGRLFQLGNPGRVCIILAQWLIWTVDGGDVNWFTIVHLPSFRSIVPNPLVLEELELLLVGVNVSRTLPFGVTEPNIVDEMAGKELICVTVSPQK
jgi:hypothetical protein